MPRFKSAEERRSTEISVMVTPAEKDELIRAAEERLTTVSALVRQATLILVRKDTKTFLREMEPV
jgi:hypothetical protein